jgi:protein TonB
MRYRKLPEYDIKLRYQQQLELGAIAGILIFVLVFMISKEIKVQVHQRELSINVIEVEEVEQTIQEKVAPPPSLPTVPIASEDEDLPDDLEYDIGEEIEWDDDFAPPPPPMLDAPVDFYSVEQKPVMIGGPKALYKKVRYPEMAEKAGVEGLAQIVFTVGKTGVPRDFEVRGEKPKGLGFADAAIAALGQMRFEPGYQRDKAVPVRMSQTVKFTVD